MKRLTNQHLGASMSPARPTHLARAGLLIASTLCASLILAASASAAAPTAAGSFTCSGAAACGADTSITPNRLDTDQATGDVYVLDAAHGVVDRFSASGAYLSQLQGTETGIEDPFNFGEGDPDIAVDNSGGQNQGNVYIVDEKHAVLFAFDAQGNFLWQSGEELSEPCGVAVDSAGNPWVANFVNGVQKHSATDGSAVGDPVVVTGDSCHIAFDASDNLYLNHWLGTVDKYVAPVYTEHSQVGTHTSEDVAVDASIADVYTTNGAEVFVVDAVGDEVEGTPFDAGQFGLDGVSVNGAMGKIYVSNPAAGAIESFNRVGGAPAKPSVRTAAASSVTEDSALLAGKVNPNGTATTCEVQYVNDVAFQATGFAAASTQACEAAVGSGTAEADVSASLAGLTAKTTYHYRFLATGAGTTAGSAATFETATPKHALDVALAGSGSGTVQCSVGPAAPGPCASEYEEGAEVTLIETPLNSSFSEWSGACSGASSTCLVTIGAADVAVTATFLADSETLTVSKSGSGSGSVTCNGGPCAPSYLYGAEVTLAATAAPSSSFAGWSGGGCSGTGACKVTLRAATTVTAAFIANPPPPAPVTPQPVPAPTPPAPPSHKPLICKKGFKKQKVKGKAVCKKIGHKHHHKRKR